MPLQTSISSISIPMQPAPAGRAVHSGGLIYDRGVMTLSMIAGTHHNSGLRHSARQDARRNARHATTEQTSRSPFSRKCLRIEISTLEFESSCGLSDRRKGAGPEFQRLCVSDVPECLAIGWLKDWSQIRRAVDSTVGTSVMPRGCVHLWQSEHSTASYRLVPRLRARRAPRYHVAQQVSHRRLRFVDAKGIIRAHKFMDGFRGQHAGRGEDFRNQGYDNATNTEQPRHSTACSGRHLQPSTPCHEGPCPARPQ